MICFLTSRIDDPVTGELNKANRFSEELRRCFPSSCRALHICSDPDGWERTDYYAKFTRQFFEKAGFEFESFDTLDGRNEKDAKKLINNSDMLILAGGHVPTQNRFFHKIGLRGLMKDYGGIVIGISAGSMNSAGTVYSQPEEEGEATDPSYQRFLPGLDLTKIMLLPHYGDIKDNVLDGLRIFEDIAYPDSMGRTFYAIPDGSYLFIDRDRSELRGEAYMIKDGKLSKVCSDNCSVPV